MLSSLMAGCYVTRALALARRSGQARQMDSQTQAQLPDEELPRVMELIRGSDSVELKLTVPEEYGRSAASALGVDPLDAHIRQIFFFDTPELALDSAGVVVRARRIQRGKDDTVVKLRPVEPAELPDEVRRAKGFKVEVDAMPGGVVCSASFKGRAGEGEVLDAVAGRARLSRLFSKEQRDFYAMHAPDGIELDDLSVLGPVFVLKLKYTPEGAVRPLTVELWNYPDGSRILELSTKTVPSEAFQAVAETRAFLLERGVLMDGKQETKTRTALEFFARELTGA
jgi:hypothetical protein